MRDNRLLIITFTLFILLYGVLFTLSANFQIFANSEAGPSSIEYIYGEATAYTPSAGGINADDNPEVTATNTEAKEGVIAVNPEVIPYGSEVLIIHGDTVIRGTAEDTGGAMRQNPKQVDILMEDLEKAKEWGRRDVHIIWW